MINFPMLHCEDDDPARPRIVAMLDAAKPLTYLIMALPASPERDAAMQAHSNGVCWAYQAILREERATRVLVASAGHQ